MSYTNIGLVDYCKEVMNIKSVYVLGEYGRKLVQKNIDDKCKQYSFNTPRKLQYEKLLNQGYYAFDCVGLIKSYYWGGYGKIKYVSSSDVNDQSMLKRATKKGKIATLPQVPGVCVVMSGHIGVYDGNGYVYEVTSNTKFAKQSHNLGGMCKTKLSDRKWTDWCYCPFIEYVEETPNTSLDAQKPTSKPLLVGSSVKIKQSAKAYVNTPKQVLIPQWVKDRTHTIKQMSSDRVLLKEINSWVYNEDVEVI